jgi:xylan 1,4-beta-xylosidase
MYASFKSECVRSKKMTKEHHSMKRKFLFLPVLCFIALCSASVTTQGQAQSSQEIQVDASAKGEPFPHYWEQMFGSGRAILSLREGYRQDLREVKAATDFKYVRFHAIFHDEAGVFDEDASGNAIYNFSYVDQIYDGLLKNGVRPFVELSFMPKKLAAENDIQGFWYRPNVSPPKDYARWGDLIHAFGKHLVDRYGIEEVSQWYFEVWNEPNLDFWAGKPREETYYKLYDTSVLALKSVSPRLRVGGPATAQAAWADRFIEHVVKNNIPVDFVSTHVYGNDKSEDVFGTHEPISRNQMVCRAVKKVHDQIKASSKPDLPLIWSEFNASYFNEPEVTDTTFMGPWMADTIRQCDGIVDMMSYWTFSDVFEEQGVVKKPFYGGFGLLAEDGLPKPAFNAFKLLHMLGDARIPVNADDALATRRADGSLAIALWNLSLPEEMGEAKKITLDLKSLRGSHEAKIYRVDSDHGSIEKAYVSMGSPVNPTELQIRMLREAGQLAPPETVHLREGHLELTLAPKALLLIEIR